MRPAVGGGVTINGAGRALQDANASRSMTATITVTKSQSWIFHSFFLYPITIRF